MKLILPVGMLFFALSFCGLGDFLSKSDDGATEVTETSTKESGDKTSDEESDVEVAKLTSGMEAALEGGEKIVWEDQGMDWQVPKGWPKMTVTKKMLNYGSPAKGFLIVSISSLGASFPVDVSTKAYYDQAVQKAKDGDYEKVQYTMIDGVKGVEFIESMPEDKGDPRRHQWIGYRKYNDQTQMLNVMVSTKGSNFDKNKETFNAILYSMKIAN